MTDDLAAIQRALTSIPSRIQTRLKTALEPVVNRIFEEARANTEMPFLSKPSYFFGPDAPGWKKYPNSDGIGFFSNRSPALPDEWRRRTQLKEADYLTDAERTALEQRRAAETRGRARGVHAQRSVQERIQEMLRKNKNLLAELSKHAGREVTLKELIRKIEVAEETRQEAFQADRNDEGRIVGSHVEQRFHNTNARHFVHELLAKEVQETEHGIIARVGYPAGIENAEETQYVKFIQTGTRDTVGGRAGSHSGMQARPFLRLLMQDHQEQLVSAVREAIRAGLKGV